MQEWTSTLRDMGAAWQAGVADLSQTLQQSKGALDVVSVRLHGHEVRGSGGFGLLPAVPSADIPSPSIMCKGKAMLSVQVVPELLCS